jgi:ElaA protein
MECIVKTFHQLTVDELYEILKLRVDVFVAEQKCAYREIDGLDREAVHVYLKDDEGIQAYVRVLKAGAKFETAGLSRIIAKKRGTGLGARIVNEGIEVAKEFFAADTISLDAQAYAIGFYEKLGFVPTSEEFLEAGIPRVRMARRG